MSDLKTKKNAASVKAYLDGIIDDQRRKDCIKINKLMEKATGEKGAMWGKSIVGFGTYHYKYASGREGDWMLTGFSSRKQALTLYIMSGFNEYETLLKDLGKFKTGVSCLYIKSLNDINIDILEELIRRSVVHMKETNK
ncbi:DUF1801 domain-containing protein [Candidatus Dojkabacteria bacterium]|uniref:DUF1801 domain-containing protein n=1 Tax=Candidatus Dojkabacteria bacterium TaxID=2099670 RepID=A0A955L699_9BACT|nr:DUF1801 domain-containing protein [Candidatus Dojkabacteria bacterium]